jgi:hypothetical protein
MSIRDAVSSVFSALSAWIALGLLAGVGFGVLAGWQLAQPDLTQLVMPKAPEQNRALKLTEQLKAPDLADDKLAVQNGPMWQLTPDGKDLFTPLGAPTGQATPAPPQEWVMVGRLKRADGMGLVLYQKQAKVSKFFKLQDLLPDGRKILSVDDIGFELGAAKGKKKQRFEYGAGLTVIETPPPENPLLAPNATAPFKSSVISSVASPAVSPTTSAAVSPTKAPAKR